MDWSSHNEAFSSQLCSSGFQFHTQPSVSPLNGHHCPHDTCSYGGSFPLHPLAVLQSAPLLPLRLRTPLCLILLSFTHSHTRRHSSSDHVSVCVFTLPICQRCFDVFPCRPSPPLVSVHPPVWWVNPSGTWHLAPLEMTCQMSHLINISLFFSLSYSYFLLLSFDSVPSRPTLRKLYINSLTCCAGTAVFKRYPGSLRQQRPAGCLFPSPKFPRLASKYRQQKMSQLAYWRRKKARRWPRSLPLSVARDPQWLNLK